MVFAAMRTTIDGAGRIVIPKHMRDEIGLTAGAEVEVELHDGRIEIEPTSVDSRLVIRNGHPVFETDVEMPVLTAGEVRDVLERIRR
jgi:AbrB family looped-hinge helix DNA binding protein